MNRHLIVLTVVTFVTALLQLTGKNKRTSKLTAIVVGVLIMGTYLGLRSWWIADNIKYHTQFMTVGPTSLREMLNEKLFNVGLRYYFHIIYTYFGKNFQIALIGIAILQMTCLAYVVYKYSDSVSLSYFTYIFLGFYYFMFTGLKQGVAMAFLLIAYTGVIENRFFKFLIFTLIASLFHAPAFIFIIAYPWSHMKLGRNYLFFLIIITILVLVFRNQIVNILSDMYYEDSDIVTASGLGGRFIAMAVILGFSMLVRPPVQSDLLYYKTFNIIILAALIQSFSIFGNNFTRLADYYFQFSIIYIPLILKYRNPNTLSSESVGILRFTKESYSIAIIVFLLLGFVYYWHYTADDISGINNAPFFWEVSQTPWGS